MSEYEYDARNAWLARLDEVRLSPGHRLVARTLAGLVAADGIGVVSNGELVRRTRLHRTTVIRALRQLDRLEWLKQLIRGGYTPTGVRLSKWQLRTPSELPVPGLKVASSDVEPVVSRSHPATFTGVSRSQEATLTGVKVADSYPSRSQIATLPLGSKNKDEDSSSLGVSLTRDGGASLAVLSTTVVHPDEVEAVVQAIPEILRARVAVDVTGGGQGADNQRRLVMERLANGVTVQQLVDDGYRVARDAQRILARGGTIDRPVGWYGKTIRHPPRPQPKVVEWCGECDPAGEHEPMMRWREFDNGAAARCVACHPEEVRRREEQRLAFERVTAS